MAIALRSVSRRTDVAESSNPRAEIRTPLALGASEPRVPRSLVLCARMSQFRESLLRARPSPLFPVRPRRVTGRRTETRTADVCNPPLLLSKTSTRALVAYRSRPEAEAPSSFGECFGSRRNHPLWRAVTNGGGPSRPRTPPKRPSLWRPVAAPVAEPQGLLPSLAKIGSADAPREEQSFPDQGHLPLTETLASFHRAVARYASDLGAFHPESSPSPGARPASPDPPKGIGFLQTWRRLSTSTVRHNPRAQPRASGPPPHVRD